MSFDNQYPNRKDHRAPYPPNQSGAVRSCRPHGSCPWCAGKRLAKRQKLLQAFPLAPDYWTASEDDLGAAEGSLDDATGQY